MIFFLWDIQFNLTRIMSIHIILLRLFLNPISTYLDKINTSSKIILKNQTTKTTLIIHMYITTRPVSIYTLIKWLQNKI